MALPERFPIIAIMGPTAVGKTSIAIRLARQIGAEIVNVDSVQIYKRLDIGSAKPTPEERAMVPHHLVDILEPDEPMDAARFARMARSRIARILEQGKGVVLAGGTGLYMRAVLNGISQVPGRHPGLRQSFRQAAERLGVDWLHRQLEAVDPEAAARVGKNDLYRIIRGLEVFYETGMAMSEWFRAFPPRPLHLEMGRAVLRIGLMLPRRQLYKRIEARVDEMMASGFVDEVRGLLDAGFSPRLRPLQSIGYRHIILFLLGRKTYEEAVYELKRDTRRFAKRQLTWFRSEPGICWYDARDLWHEKALWEALH